MAVRTWGHWRLSVHSNALFLSSVGLSLVVIRSAIHTFPWHPSWRQGERMHWIGGQSASILHSCSERRRLCFFFFLLLRFSSSHSLVSRSAWTAVAHTKKQMINFQSCMIVAIILFLVLGTQSCVSFAPCSRVWEWSIVGAGGTSQDHNGPLIFQHMLTLPVLLCNLRGIKRSMAVSLFSTPHQSDRVLVPFHRLACNWKWIESCVGLQKPRSVGHFNKTVFNSGSPKLGESQGLGESLRLSPILGESSLK